MENDKNQEIGRVRPTSKGLMLGCILSLLLKSDGCINREDIYFELKDQMTVEIINAVLDGLIKDGCIEFDKDGNIKGVIT